MPTHLDRRRQPQATIKAIGEVLRDIDWSVKEVTSQKFVEPTGKWVNESFGYVLKIPREMDEYINKLWIGYLAHQKLQPGIYAGMDPEMSAGPSMPTPLSTGYRLSPEGFESWMLLKQIIPQEQIAEMEKRFGSEELKRKIKQILVKTYPFSLK